MNRDELLTMLAGLVEEGRLAQDEAAAILRRFDAGEIAPETLPLPADETNPDATPLAQLLSAYKVGAQGWAPLSEVADGLEAVASETGTASVWAAAEANAFLSTRAPATVEAVGEVGTFSVAEDAADVIPLRVDPADVDEALNRGVRILNELAEDAAQRTAVEITASFEEQARALTRAYKSGRLSVAQWQDEMMSLIREDVLAQAQTGAGRRLTPGQIRRLQDTIDEQAAYLRRFAEEVAARAETDDAMSLARMVDRSRQYGGHGYGEYYKQAEAGLQEGIVIDYNAVDDQLTCSPCVQAERNGPYLPGQGPMPGLVCLASGKCRCTRTQRYDPDTYQQLT